MNDYALMERPPTLGGYRQLHEAVGWGNIGREATETGLRNSLFRVTALDGETEIGCGRVIGDGGLYFYVQDVIVLPA